jgi:hypothetical protein
MPQVCPGTPPPGVRFRYRRLRGWARQGGRALFLDSLPPTIPSGVTIHVLNDEVARAHPNRHLIAQHHGANVGGLWDL